MNDHEIIERMAAQLNEIMADPESPLSGRVWVVSPRNTELMNGQLVIHLGGRVVVDEPFDTSGFAIRDLSDCAPTLNGPVLPETHRGKRVAQWKIERRGKR